MRKAVEIPQNVFFEEGPAAEGAAAPVTAKRQAVKRSSSQTTKRSRPQAVKQSSGQKVQVTFYLGGEAARELERLRYELLARHDVRASRSAIVEAAILEGGDGLLARLAGDGGEG